MKLRKNTVLNFLTHTQHMYVCSQLFPPGWLMPGLCVSADMLHSEDHRRLEMAIRCLEVLCVRVESFWKDMMDAGDYILHHHTSSS